MFGLGTLLKKLFPNAIWDADDLDGIAKLQEIQKQRLENKLHQNFAQIVKKVGRNTQNIYTTTTTQTINLTPKQYEKYLKLQSDNPTTFNAKTLLTIEDLDNSGIDKNHPIYNQLKDFIEKNNKVSDQNTFHPF